MKLILKAKEQTIEPLWKMKANVLIKGSKQSCLTVLIIKTS